MDTKIKQLHHYSKGQVIIEALIALGLLTTGVVSILVLINSSLRTLSYAPNQYLAANLAAEGIEIVRNIIDSDIIQMPDKAWNETISDKNFACTDSFEVDYLSTDLARCYQSSQPIFLSIVSDVDGNNLYRYPQLGETGTATPFTREIKITETTTDYIKFQSIVHWTEKGIDFDVQLEDWYYRPVEF